MKRFLVLTAMLAVTVGCECRSTDATSNPNIPVTLLFEHDGVKMYRFHDCGRDIYYADASGRVEWRIDHGKGDVERRAVDTVE